jgi:threonine dehydratase
MIPDIWLDEATRRIAAHITNTPLTYDPENNLYLKWENHQVTGSFKARGAINKVLTLQLWERERGLVTASAGNHGQGVALAGKQVGAKVTIFVSEHAVPAKIESMRALGATVMLVPGGYGEAELAGLAYAGANQTTWISPYNDGQVIAGQATVALEILREKPELSSATWVVPTGGGGLISGIGAALKVRSRAILPEGIGAERLVGVQSEASAFMYSIYRNGSQEGVDDLPSLADGLAGPVEDNSLTIPLVKRWVDAIVLVSEKEIEQAIAIAWRRYAERIEGAAATALAAVFSSASRPFPLIPERPAVIIISGGNIQPEVHAKILKDR